MTTNSDADAGGDPALRMVSVAVPLLRVTVGVILLVTWFDNLDKDLYTGDGLSNFIEFLFAEDGNGSSLSAYQSVLDAIVVPAAGFFSRVQLVVELAMALALIFGFMTRLFSLVAAGFFASLLLAYFGGEEWIWTYVLLLASAVTVFLGAGGRRFGVDRLLVEARGRSPYGLLW
ncbi:MAG: DoxX family protein [Acidimicrobiales bacterium]